MKLPASLDSLEPFRLFVQGKAGELGVSSEFQNNVELVLEEVLVNVVRYAYPEEGEGSVEVGCGVVDGQMFCIRIRDSGRPFNPLLQPDPDLSRSILDKPVGGLGIFLVRQIADSVGYERVDGYNQLTCCLKCP